MRKKPGISASLALDDELGELVTPPSPGAQRRLAIPSEFRAHKNPLADAAKNDGVTLSRDDRSPALLGSAEPPSFTPLNP